MVFVGGSIALVLAVIVFFATSRLPLMVRERIAAALICGGAVAVGSGAFYVSPEVGYMVSGALVLAIGILFAFDGSR